MAATSIRNLISRIRDAVRTTRNCLCIYIYIYIDPKNIIVVLARLKRVAILENIHLEQKFWEIGYSVRIMVYISNTLMIKITSQPRNHSLTIASLSCFSPS